MILQTTRLFKTVVPIVIFVFWFNKVYKRNSETLVDSTTEHILIWKNKDVDVI